MKTLYFKGPASTPFEIGVSENGVEIEKTDLWTGRSGKQIRDKYQSEKKRLIKKHNLSPITYTSL